MRFHSFKEAYSAYYALQKENLIKNKNEIQNLLYEKIDNQNITLLDK